LCCSGDKGVYKYGEIEGPPEEETGSGFVALTGVGVVPIRNSIIPFPEI
jgi:hypothetical protein